MKQLIFIIALFFFIGLKAQQQLPGGVTGAYIWNITENNQSEQARWKSKLKTSSDTGSVFTGKNKIINNNPALYINAGNASNSLNLGKLISFSLFTVCQENDTLSEKVIVSLENDTAPELVLTNLRMAALDVYRYANYDKNNNLIPKIYSYAQNKPKDSVSISRRLQLGRPPRNQNLPVALFKGIIPELILFNRYLSLKERQKVESYLALKYGISLNQEFPVSYLNSKGEIIWDADINAAFNKNIAGIGRDDVSGLYQKISESIQTPGVLKIGSLNELKNNTFLTWGDNGKALRFTDETGIRQLQREWKIAIFNSGNDSVFAETNVMSLNEINPLQADETYWMMIDRSGTGRYSFKQTGYIQCQPMASERGIIYFKHLTVDPDHSGSDIFTLLAAPSFFTRSLILSPTCTSLQAGIIQTEIAGGTPPYVLTLKDISNPGFQMTSKEHNNYHTFENISQGAYILQIRDANGNAYTEKIWVSNKHLWETKISRNYKIIDGETLTLDASKGMPAVNYTYAWTWPDGSVSSNEIINITQPGNYLLSITDDNYCNTALEINVEKTEKGNFKYLELLPNPTNGWFVVRIDLEHPSDINMTISDMSGKVIKQTLLQNNYYYWYSDKIQQQGIYFIVLTTGNEKQTLKLVVQ